MTICLFVSSKYYWLAHMKKNETMCLDPNSILSLIWISVWIKKIQIQISPFTYYYVPCWRYVLSEYS